MQNTPRGNRLHIAIFGRRNAGKSSLMNALTSQDIALVSSVPGTTTDPVYKAMEILPLGPVVLIDTAGIDDAGELGEMRVRRSRQVLNQADLALLVMDIRDSVTVFEKEIVDLCREKKLPVITLLNKTDLRAADEEKQAECKKQLGLEPLAVSAQTGQGITELKIAMIQTAPASWDDQSIVGDLLEPGDTAVLVVPIDLAAPKGRLILPQVQTIRDILDHDAFSVVVKERELQNVMEQFAKKPKIVITDSQAFLKADADTPPDVLLTSFSILFARYKGDLETLVAGARGIDSLIPGDRVLMAEACTHHRVEDDIGRVKIPRWLRRHVGGELQFDWASGQGFPENLRDYKLIIHCGGCMINRREMLARIARAQDAGISIVNYGVAIAHLMGILQRALSPFPDIAQLLETNHITEGRVHYGE